MRIFGRPSSGRMEMLCPSKPDPVMVGMGRPTAGSVAASLNAARLAPSTRPDPVPAAVKLAVDAGPTVEAGPALVAGAAGVLAVPAPGKPLAMTAMTAAT